MILVVQFFHKFIQHYYVVVFAFDFAWLAPEFWLLVHRRARDAREKKKEKSF